MSLKALIFDLDGVPSPRPGAARLVAEAHAGGFRPGVCATARKSSVMAVLERFGQARKDRVEHALAGWQALCAEY